MRMALLILLGGCALVSDDNEKFRLDPDGDGVEWPNDCDDENETIGAALNFYPDEDGDGYGDINANPTPSCNILQNHVLSNDDCDDSNADISPAAIESCDGIDNNCNDAIDDEEIGEVENQNTYYRDDDGDNYGVGDNVTSACENPGAGWSAQLGDCDDRDPNVNPEGTEICNDIDDNCNGVVDDGDFPSFYIDADGDGFGDMDDVEPKCGENEIPEGYSDNAGDCNDEDLTINPNAPETCDVIDNNCDGLVDDADPLVTGQATLYNDADGDGYGDINAPVTACFHTDNETSMQMATDCDDTDAFKNLDDFDSDGHTTCGVETCFDIRLFDGYGDGWNGGTLDVIVGPLTTSYTFTSTDGIQPGFAYDIQHCVTGGQYVEFNYTPGSFSTENQYEIAIGNQVYFSDGNLQLASAPMTGVVFGMFSNHDCDDANPNIHPGITDTCDDYIDTNCDGLNDKQVLSEAALALDGVDDYVAIEEPAANNLSALTPGSGFTVEAWVNTASSDNQYIWAQTNPTYDNGYIVGMQNGKIFAQYWLDDGSVNICYGSTTFSDGQWHHVAYTYIENVGIKLFLDGNVEEDCFIQDFLYSYENASEIFIGGNFGAQVPIHYGPFAGMIDNLRVWNTPRDNVQVAADRCRTVSPNHPWLAGNWPFENGSSTTAIDVAQGNDGTFYSDAYIGGF